MSRDWTEWMLNRTEYRERVHGHLPTKSFSLTRASQKFSDARRSWSTWHVILPVARGKMHHIPRCGSSVKTPAPVNTFLKRKPSRSVLSIPAGRTKTLPRKTPESSLTMVPITVHPTHHQAPHHHVQQQLKLAWKAVKQVCNCVSYLATQANVHTHTPAVYLILSNKICWLIKLAVKHTGQII